jgi:hypothetical protein
MTMPYERRKAVERTRELLVDLLWEKYEEAPRGGELWEEVSRCLKHFPSEYYMDEARELAPEVFGDWQQDEKLTRIEIIGDDGREVVKYAPEGHYYRRSVQDNGRTVKFFVEKKNGEHECPGVGKCQDQGCPAHYASDEIEKKNG